MKNTLFPLIMIACAINMPIQSTYTETALNFKDTALNFMKNHKSDIIYGGLALGWVIGADKIIKSGENYQAQACALLNQDGRREKISQLMHEVDKLNTHEYNKPYWQNSADLSVSPYIHHYVQRISHPANHHITMGQRKFYYFSLDAFCKGEMDNETYEEYCRLKESAKKAHYSAAGKLGVFTLGTALVGYGLKSWLLKDSSYYID